MKNNIQVNSKCNLNKIPFVIEGDIINSILRNVLISEF